MVMQLQKLDSAGVIKYIEGQVDAPELLKQDADDATKQRLEHIASSVFGRWGGTGVLAAVSQAVALRPPVLVYPVCDLETLKTSNKDTDQLSQCVVFKPGSTVFDVYEALKRRSTGASIGATANAGRGMGEYVRAEALTEKGLRSVLKKDELVGEHNCVMRIMTNKKVAWQAKTK